MVDDSYNANPSSMKAALSAFLAEPVKGKRYACLGDMRELGEKVLWLIANCLNPSPIILRYMVLSLLATPCNGLGSEIEAGGAKNKRRDKLLATQRDAVTPDTAAELADRFAAGDRI